MPSKIVKALKKVRGKRKPMQVNSTKDRKISEYYAQKRLEEGWERDKHIVRMQNFEKAKLGLKEYRAEIQAEKDRQQQIVEQRLENLKKARKALQKKRSKI